VHRNPSLLIVLAFYRFWDFPQALLPQHSIPRVPELSDWWVNYSGTGTVQQYARLNVGGTSSTVEVSTTQASLASISTEATDVEVEAKDVGDLFEYDGNQCPIGSCQW